MCVDKKWKLGERGERKAQKHCLNIEPYDILIRTAEDRPGGKHDDKAN